jgi:hypothetical protein
MPELNKFYETWEKILTCNLFDLLDQLNFDLGTYFDSYNLISMIILIILGILLNYAGAKVHKILMPLVIGSIGGFFTAMVVNSVNQNEMTILISTIIAGAIFALISFLLLRISFVLLGIIFGMGLVATAGYDQVEIYAVVGIVFAILAWFLYNFTVIALTCISGSVVLTYAMLNSYVLIRSHYAQIYAKSLGLYVQEMMTPFLKPTLFPAALSAHKLDYFLLFVFLLTGFTFQYGMKLLPALGKGKKKLKPQAKPIDEPMNTEINESKGNVETS